MKFGSILKSIMIEQGVSQMTLANAIGVSQRAVSRWINLESEPTESAIKNCANFFGVSTDYILGYADEYGNKIEEKKTTTPEKIKLPAVARSKGNKLRNITLELTEEQLNTLIAEIKGEKE